MVQLFEDYPATESLLLWYPTVVVAAELTLPLTRRNVDKSVQLPVTYASTAFFLTLINLETAHFKILYGRAGLVAAAFLLNLWSGDYSHRASSSGNPCTLVVHYWDGRLRARHCLVLFGAQCVGAAAGLQAAKRVWSVGLCEFHRDRALAMTAERCASHLAVSWPHGLAFEFSTTLLHRVTFSTNFTRHRSLESHVKLLISIVVAVVNMDYTGFYLHPLAASVRTVGCGKTPILEHLIVYWVGALGGTVAAIVVQPTVDRMVGHDKRRCHNVHVVRITIGVPQS